MICARCHRTLLRPPVLIGGLALGPRCATAVAGAKPRRSQHFNFRRPGADARQRDLFTEATP
ncbi:hypothetical protein [Variovorax sp. YR634]|uniref:hypothetical protein n=1 Tax=Variovorax sp. YR634 TaxID=1884385 RepID=UPI0015A3D57D|nr:hypothetical protein [Variovorax sp. YR634]